MTNTAVATKKKRYAVTTNKMGNIEIRLRNKLSAYVSVWPSGYYLSEDRVKGVGKHDDDRAWATLNELLTRLEKKWRIQANPKGDFEEYEIAFDLTRYKEGPALIRRNYSLILVQDSENVSILIPNNDTCQHCDHCPKGAEPGKAWCKAFREYLTPTEVGLFRKCMFCANAVRMATITDAIKAQVIAMAHSLKESRV